MRFRKSRLSTLGVAVLAVILLSTAAWAGDSAAPSPRAGIDADTVDGHHAAASYTGTNPQRANRVLWADGRGKIGARSLPFNAIDKRYLSAREDTLIYVPGSLMQFHMDDVNGASVRFNNTSQAIVRKEGSAGDIDLVIPIQLPAQQSGRWVKLVNMRVYYKVDNAASYIDHTWINKINATGGHQEIGASSGDQTSTSWTSYLVECPGAGCQLSWPTGGFVTVRLGLRFGGTGDPHEIQIGGVLMRVSYDG